MLLLTLIDNPSQFGHDTDQQAVQQAVLAWLGVIVVGQIPAPVEPDLDGLGQRGVGVRFHCPSRSSAMMNSSEATACARWGRPDSSSVQAPCR